MSAWRSGWCARGGACCWRRSPAARLPPPWVKPYEREHFADPIMSFNRDPVSSTYLDHVFESREGARGATGTVGGGCGCN